MHHRKMPAGRASLHRRQRHAIDRLMPFTGAPLFHALQLLATSDSARFHMPGHKGQPVFNSFRDVFAIDYTETYGTGNLYLGDGPIRDRRLDAGHPRHARRGSRPRRQRAHRPRGAPFGLPRLRPARHHAVFLLRAPARAVRHYGRAARRGRRASAARPSRHPRRPAHLAHLLRPATRPSGLRRSVPRTRKAAAHRRSSRRALPGGRPAFSGRGGRGYGRALHAQDHALSRAGGCASLRTGHRPRVPAREHRPVRHLQPLLPHHGLDRPRTRI